MLQGSWIDRGLRALLAWLLFWEALAARNGWHGLRWLPGRPTTDDRRPTTDNRQSRVGLKDSRQRILDYGSGQWRRMLRPYRVVLGRWSMVRGLTAFWLGWRAGPLALILTALPAALLQSLLASLRQPQLDPGLRLRPGTYPGYTVERLELPLASGALPALHIVPRGGARRAVCVLHGSGSSKTTYTWPLVDTLTAAGVALLLVDLDGHGENPRPQRFPQILENPQAAVDWLRPRYDRVTLLGISLGGCIAARAVADGLAVDQLIVLESPPLLRFGRRDVWREGFALLQPQLFYLFEDCTPRQLLRAWQTPGIKAEISTWDLIAACNLTEALGRVSVPLLVVYGGRDAIVKPAQAAEVWRALPPQASFVSIGSASHLTLILTPAALRAIRDAVA